MSNLADLGISVSAKIDDFVNGMKKVPAAAAEAGEKAKAKFEGLGQKLGPIMQAGGVAAGAALVFGFVKELDNEKVLDKLSAQLGPGSLLAQDAGTAAGNLYADAYGESMAQVGDAVQKVFQSGILSPDEASQAEIEAVTARVLDLSTAFDKDLSASTNAVAQLMRTGLASSAEEAFDLITRGMQQGVDKSDDLLETINEYGTVWRDAGLSGADAMGLMSQGLKTGARDADTVADALKEFAIRAQDGSEMSASGFERIGLSAEEMTAKVAAGGPGARDALDQVLDGLRAMTDPAERNAAAVELFGTKAEDLGDSLFALDLDTAAEGMGDIADAAERMGDELNDNDATKIEAFRRQALEKLTNFIGTTAIPAIERMVQIGKTIGEWAMEHKPILIGLAATIGVVLVAAFLAWASAAWAAAVATTWLTWPLIAIAAAIGLLVAGVIWAYQNWGWFRDAVDAVASFITGTLWPVIQKTASWLADTLGPAIGAVVSWFQDTLIPAIAGVISWLSGKVPAILDILRNPFAAARDAIGEIWNVITSKVSGAWNDITKAAATGAMNLLSLVRGLPGMIIDFLSGLPGMMLNVGVNMIQGLINGIKAMASRAANAAVNVVKAAVDAAKSFLIIGSPSKLFAGFGENVGQGFIIGMDKMQSAVTKSGQALAGSSVPDMPRASMMSPGGSSTSPGLTYAPQGPQRVVIEFTGNLTEDMFQMIRRNIRINGGNVQAFLGQGA